MTSCGSTRRVAAAGSRFGAIPVRTTSSPARASTRRCPEKRDDAGVPFVRWRYRRPDAAARVHLRRSPLRWIRRRHACLGTAGQRRAPHQPQLQISPAARYLQRGIGGAERAGPAWPGRAHGTERPRDHARTLRGPHGNQPELLAVRGLRLRRCQRCGLRTDPGGLLLQDFHVATHAALVAEVRASDSPRRRDGPRSDRSGSRRLRAAVCALRRACDWRRGRRTRRCSRRRAYGCAGDALRRTAALGWRHGRRRSPDRRHARPCVDGEHRARADCAGRCHPAAPHHRVRLLRRQPGRSAGTSHRSSGRDASPCAAATLLENPRQDRGARQRRDRARHRVCQQRPSRHDARGCDTDLRQALRRSARFARCHLHQQRRRLRRCSCAACRGCDHCGDRRRAPCCRPGWTVAGIGSCRGPRRARGIRRRRCAWQASRDGRRRGATVRRRGDTTGLRSRRRFRWMESGGPPVFTGAGQAPL